MCSAQNWASRQSPWVFVEHLSDNKENEVPWGDFHLSQEDSTPYILSLCFTWACLNLCLLTFWHLQEHEMGIYPYSECRGVCSVQWPGMAAVGLRGTETCSVLCIKQLGKAQQSSPPLLVDSVWVCCEPVEFLLLQMPTQMGLPSIWHCWCCQTASMAAFVFLWTNTQTHTTGPCVVCAASLGR